jgi:hypothetical protein
MCALTLLGRGVFVYGFIKAIEQKAALFLAVSFILEKKMKRKLSSVIIILVFAVLSACGPDATPTMSVADVQGTAIADAWIALTQTQAAMPTTTETLIPPTHTPTFIPGPTFTPFPTIVPATLPDTSAIDPCNEPPPAKPKGDKVKIKFLNKSNGNVALSFGMVHENEEKECGTYSFSLGVYEEPVVEVLAGCYWGYAWVNGKVPSTAKTIDNLCVTDTSKTTSIWISTEVISFH